MGLKESGRKKILAWINALLKIQKHRIAQLLSNGIAHKPISRLSAIIENQLILFSYHMYYRVNVRGTVNRY
jgi:hypothetical protein